MRSIRDDARALHERFFSLARRRSLRDPVSASCEELGLTAPQVHALLWLGHDGPLTMGELARRVSVTEKTVTGIVDRLERDGYLRRERDEVDRRVVRARATPRGAEVSRVISDGVLERLARLLGLLGPADRRALFRILDRIALRLEEPGGARRPRRGESPSGRTPARRSVRHRRPSHGGRREDTER